MKLMMLLNCQHNVNTICLRLIRLTVNIINRTLVTTSSSIAAVASLATDLFFQKNPLLQCIPHF